MRQYTIKEVHAINAGAREDLNRCKLIMQSLSTVPVKLSEQEFNFLQAVKTCTPEEFKEGKNIEIWKQHIQNKITVIEHVLKTNEKWIADKTGKPHRCALPKKKQRALGLLPPV